MAYDKEKEQRKEIELNHQKKQREHEIQENLLTEKKKEVQLDANKNFEQQQNDRQSIDRKELRENEITHPKYDNPDMLNSEKQSLFDMHDDMKTVDPIPVEELNEQVNDEKNKEETKKSSGSEKKYKR